jgi:hypothetical protein
MPYALALKHAANVSEEDVEEVVDAQVLTRTRRENGHTFTVAMPSVLPFKSI